MLVRGRIQAGSAGIRREHVTDRSIDHSLHHSLGRPFAWSIIRSADHSIGRPFVLSIVRSADHIRSFDRPLGVSFVRPIIRSVVCLMCPSFVWRIISSINYPLCRPFGRPIIFHQLSRLFARSIDQSARRLFARSTVWSIDHSFGRSSCRSTNRLVHRSFSRPVTRSTDGSVDHLIICSVTHLVCRQGNSAGHELFDLSILQVLDDLLSRSGTTHSHFRGSWLPSEAHAVKGVHR